MEGLPDQKAWPVTSPNSTAQAATYLMLKPAVLPIFKAKLQPGLISAHSPQPCLNS